MQVLPEVYHPLLSFPPRSVELGPPECRRVYSLADCLQSCWQGTRLRASDLLDQEGALHKLPFRRKSRTGTILEMPDEQGKFIPYRQANRGLAQRPVQSASPKVSESIVEQAGGLGVKHIWFQPGTESQKAIARAKEFGMNVISGGPCIPAVLGYSEKKTMVHAAAAAPSCRVG